MRIRQARKILKKLFSGLDHRISTIDRAHARLHKAGDGWRLGFLDWGSVVVPLQSAQISEGFYAYTGAPNSWGGEWEDRARTESQGDAG